MSSHCRMAPEPVTCHAMQSRMIQPWQIESHHGHSACADYYCAPCAWRLELTLGQICNKLQQVLGSAC